MSRDLHEQIESTIRKFADEIEPKVGAWLEARTPVAFREMELELAALVRKLADGITGALLGAMVGDTGFQAQASLAAREARRLRNGGTREVGVTLLGGTEMRVQVEYLKPERRGRPGRQRKRRGKGGSGLYPVLAALGIWFGVTPALAGEICQQVTDSDSVRAGRAALARRDIDLGHKQTLRIVNHFSRRAVEQRDAWLEKARTQPASTGPLCGKRVLIATDGGRVRERRPARHGRRRTETGHRRYDAPWREPKLLTICVVGEDGTVEQSFQPIYDGTLGDCDAVFGMLLGYLKALGAHQAKELIVAGDAALDLGSHSRPRDRFRHRPLVRSRGHRLVPMPSPSCTRSPTPASPSPLPSAAPGSARPRSTSTPARSTASCT